MYATTEDPAEYSRFCGPRSLAAALDLPRGTTARLLLAVMRHRGLIEAPYTSEETMLLALHVLGVEVQTYGAATGERCETTAKCIARARDAAPVQPVSKGLALAQQHEVIAASPEPSRPGLLEHMRFAKSLRLSDWLRFRGVWLLDVDAPEFAHWVALRDGAVLVSRDSTFWSCRVRKALRVA